VDQSNRANLMASCFLNLVGEVTAGGVLLHFNWKFLPIDSLDVDADLLCHLAAYKYKI
jgi:hypothetical protein